jgi:signal peptidase II
MKRFQSLLIVVLVFVLDQLSKSLVKEHLPMHEPRAVIAGLLDLVYTQNTGIAFSFFANSTSSWTPLLLVAGSALLLVVLLFFALYYAAGSAKFTWGLMLVMGGATGNLYDRIRYGAVVDFIDVYLGPYHWPTFNVADSAITIGVGLLLLETLTQKPEAATTL